MQEKTMSSEFLQTYRSHVAERAALGIPPLPLTAKQTGEVIELLKSPPVGEEAFLLEEKNKEFFKNCSTFKNKKVKGDELW